MRLGERGPRGLLVGRFGVEKSRGSGSEVDAGTECLFD